MDASNVSYHIFKARLSVKNFNAMKSENFQFCFAFDPVTSFAHVILELGRFLSWTVVRIKFKKLILVHFLHFCFRLTPTKMIVSCRTFILS